jgi:urease accessory protein
VSHALEERTSLADALPDPFPARWPAHLALSFHAARGRTTLARRHSGPLVVQKALYPEGPAVCQAVVIHPPGGLAGGDELALALELAPGSHAQLTTPGAGKWYRSEGQEASQRLVAHIEGAHLEWLPQETILFDAAHARMTSEIELHGKARYLGWEILCLGRRAAGEHFSRGALRQRTTIRHDGRLLWGERCHLGGGSALLSSPVGLDGRTVVGTLILAGLTVDAPLLTACRAVRPGEAGARAGLSAWSGMLLARYLGDSGEGARRYLTALWRMLRPPFCGREAVPPRIWST